MLGLEEAQAKLLALAEPLGAEAVTVNEASGRVLAESVLALRTQPAADLSAMDGYAIGAGDHNGPWCVIGESAAGHPFGGHVAGGEAVRISTGAAMPEGADAVLLQENAVRAGETLSLTNADGPTPQHIRRAGFDFTAGDALLPVGTLLNATQLALIRMAGIEQLTVHKKPSLTVIDCGDELVADPSEASGPQIPATNGTMIAELVGDLANDTRRLGPIADSLDLVVDAFAQSDGDVIVITGGASVGEHDIVKPALEAWGAELAFWRVSIRPGKPLLVAKRGEQIILGLPGNPVSAYVTAIFFLLPLLRQFEGFASPLPNAFESRLTQDLPAGGTRVEFLRAIIGPEGVTPLMQRDSSALRMLAAANGLIRRNIDAPAAAAGKRVSVYPLQNGGIA